MVWESLDKRLRRRLSRGRGDFFGGNYFDILRRFATSFIAELLLYPVLFYLAKQVALRQRFREAG